MFWGKSVIALLLSCSCAFAQTNPNFQQGAVLTAQQLNQALQAKSDFPLGVIPTVGIITGVTPVSGGILNGLFYNNGGFVGNLTTTPNAVLSTNGSSVPALSTTLPSGLTIGTPTISNPTFTGTLTGPQTIPSSALVNTTVTAGTYGSSTAIPTFTVNTEGQLTVANTIPVIAPAGTLTGSALASNVLASSLTSVGILTTGTWNATPVGTQFGGTGLATLTANAVLLGAGTSNVQFAAIGTGGRMFIDQGGGVNPAFTILSGDCTITSAGVITCLKANGVALSALATQTLPCLVSQGCTGSTTAFTPGSVVFAGVSGVYSQDNSKIFWDDTNFRLGIGTAAPLNDLAIVNATRTFAGTTGQLHAYGTAPGATNPEFTSFGYDVTNHVGYIVAVKQGGGGTFEPLYLNPNGGVVAVNSSGADGLAVGTTTNPGSGGLQLNGQEFVPNITTSSAAQTGTVCWTTGTGKFTVDTTVGCLTSSERFKTITGEIGSTNALDIVSRLRPIKFIRKKEFGGELDPYEQFGLSAEQTASVDERLIGRDGDGLPKGVRYQELTAVLAAAIQELKAQNESLKSELEMIKNK